MILRWYYRENRWVNLPKAFKATLLSEQGGDITTGAVVAVEAGCVFWKRWRGTQLPPTNWVQEEVPKELK
jgi:hypothetical protein